MPKTGRGAACCAPACPPRCTRTRLSGANSTIEPCPSPNPVPEQSGICISWQRKGEANLGLLSGYWLLSTDYSIPDIVSQKKLGIGIGIGAYCHAERQSCHAERQPCHAERSEASRGHTRRDPSPPLRSCSGS